MKKNLISIIVILIIVLITQLIYFNYMQKENITIGNNLNQTINISNGNIVENSEEDINMTSVNEISPSNLEEVEEMFIGNKELVENLKKELYVLVNNNAREIYDMTAKKSINKILQTYDLNEEKINNMNIYSREDFLDISTQVLNVENKNGVGYLSSYIDMNTYNGDENSYTTFKLNIIYTNSNRIVMKICLANNDTTIPSIKFQKQD